MDPAPPVSRTRHAKAREKLRSVSRTSTRITTPHPAGHQLCRAEKQEQVEAQRHLPGMWLACQAADGLPPFGGRAFEGAPEELVLGLAYEPDQAMGPQALLKSWRLNGRTRTRFPVRAKTAFATAGPIGGTPGLPRRRAAPSTARCGP